MINKIVISLRRYIVDPMLLPLGNPLQSEHYLFSLWPMSPPNYFDIFSLELLDAQNICMYLDASLNLNLSTCSEICAESKTFG